MSKLILDNFATTTPNKDIDDQAHLIRKEEMHTNKDYAKYVEFAFPMVNSCVRKAIMNGEGTNWTNQTLSYMRKDRVSKMLLDHFYRRVFTELDIGGRFNLIDATANIGGDSLQFGIGGFGQVLAFEMQAEVYRMLCNNISTYKLDHRIFAKHQRFDAGKVGEYLKEFNNGVKKCIAIIDPPFEINNNGAHFNLSIANTPIYYIVEQLLAAGLSAVILSMPMCFKYNLPFAKENNHRVDVCYIDKKDLKMLVISRNYSLVDKSAPKIIVYNLITGKIAGLVLLT